MGPTKVIQVTNIAPQATKDQMHTLFGFLGKIDDIKLYPTIRDVSCPVQSRTCYVKFVDPENVDVAQHLTNTVFIDRALIVIPMRWTEIPDESKAMELSCNNTIIPGLNIPHQLPSHVTNSIEGVPPNQIILTHDPTLAAEGLPPYPPLPGCYDNNMVEEIRRTVLAIDVGNLSHQQLIDKFGEVGEVRCLRFCGRKSDDLKYAFIEMSEQASVIKALKLNNCAVDGQIIKVHHATQAIMKPLAKSNEDAQREIEEAMSQVKDAQNMISAAIDPMLGMLTHDNRRSRSRRRSHSRYYRSRSGSRHRSRGSRGSRNRRRRRSRSRSGRSRRSSSRSRRGSKSRRDRSPDDRRSDRKRDRSKSPRRNRDYRSSSKDKQSKEDERKNDSTAEKQNTEEVAFDTQIAAKTKADDGKDPKPMDSEDKDSDDGEKKGDKVDSTKADETKDEVTSTETKSEEKKDSGERSTSKRDRSSSKDVKRSRSRRTRSRSRGKSSRKKRSRSRRRSRSRKRSRSRDRRRSRSREKRGRSRNRGRSRSRDKKRSGSKDRKRSISKDRKRSKSPERRRSKSYDRKRHSDRKRKSRSRSRDRKRSRSRRRSRSKDRKRSRSSPEKTRTKSPTPALEKTAERPEQSSDNMDISNSP